MPRALVTGATGFIGSHLVETLRLAGYEVRCLVRSSSRLDLLSAHQVELVTSHLEDAAGLKRAVAGCDTIYHLAGRTSAVRRQDLYRTNGWGSYLLAQACAETTTPPCLIVVSSLAAAGTAISGRHRQEADPSAPISEYGRSKRAGELAAAAWASRVPISIVRPGIVFGPRNEEMLPMFRSIARLRIHAVPGYQPRRVGLIHHTDLIDILLRVEKEGQRLTAAATCPPCSRSSVARRVRLDNDDGDNLRRYIVNDESSHENGSQSIGRYGVSQVSVSPHRFDGQGYYFAVAPEFPTYAELGRMIARALGTGNALILPIAEVCAWLAAAGNQYVNLARGRTDSFNLDKMREAFAGDWTGCTLRLEQELGFAPSCSLQTRLNETAEWYRANGWL